MAHQIGLSWRDEFQTWKNISLQHQQSDFILFFSSAAKLNNEKFTLNFIRFFTFKSSFQLYQLTAFKLIWSEQLYLNKNFIIQLLVLLKSIKAKWVRMNYWFTLYIDKDINLIKTGYHIIYKVGNYFFLLPISW